jgi:hypothetical protein
VERFGLIDDVWLLGIGVDFLLDVGREWLDG